ncbi:MAG: hypothetical protein ACLR7Z_19905 [Bilophila wadsworthia]
MAQRPFATNNGYDGLDTKLLFNSPCVKRIDFLSKLQKDGVMVYVGRKSKPSTRSPPAKPASS